MTRTASASSRSLSRKGRDVTLRNYYVDTEDDYGEDYAETAGSPYTIPAFLDRSGSTPQSIRDAFGADISVDVVAFIEAGTSAANGVVDGGGDGASEFALDGTSYVVLRATDQGNGLLRLDATREN